MTFRTCRRCGDQTLASWYSSNGRKPPASLFCECDRARAIANEEAAKTLSKEYADWMSTEGKACVEWMLSPLPPLCGPPKKKAKP